MCRTAGLAPRRLNRNRALAGAAWCPGRAHAMKKVESERGPGQYKHHAVRDW
jgi:hypothetical protein